MTIVLESQIAELLPAKAVWPSVLPPALVHTYVLPPSSPVGSREAGFIGKHLSIVMLVACNSNFSILLLSINTRACTIRPIFHTLVSTVEKLIFMYFPIYFTDTLPLL